MAKGALREGTFGLRWCPPCAVRRIDAVMLDNFKSVIPKRAAFVSYKNRRFQQIPFAAVPAGQLNPFSNTEVRRAECDSVGTAVALHANSPSSQSELG